MTKQEKSSRERMKYRNTRFHSGYKKEVGRLHMKGKTKWKARQELKKKRQPQEKQAIKRATKKADSVRSMGSQLMQKFTRRSGGRGQ